jgi:NADPH2 dehydrogenase
LWLYAGYLIDQFTQDAVNKRTDKWGGSIENRSRFGLEVAKAVVAAVGADRVGMRLSPWSDWQGMGMTDRVPQFSHLIRGLSELKLAYIHLIESRVHNNFDKDYGESLDFALEAWGSERPVLMAGGFTPALAKEWVDEKYKDRNVVVVFGRHFLANPDLPYRVLKGIEFTPYVRAKFYTAKQEDGYTTYPFSEGFLAQYGTH